MKTYLERKAARLEARWRRLKATAEEHEELAYQAERRWRDAARKVMAEACPYPMTRAQWLSLQGELGDAEKQRDKYVGVGWDKTLIAWPESP